MRLTAFVTLATWSIVQAVKHSTGTTYPTKSGIEIWVDPATPADRQTYVSSRGRKWDLVMSDEFNTKSRSFRPGDDHMWTSIDKPDGVNGALEIYSHNMTSTNCDDDDDGTCYFYIQCQDEVNVIEVYNMYTQPPGYEKAYFFYRAAMVQSWNKLCFQGGMLEVRAQLPGAVSKESGNPDLALGGFGKVKTSKFYPTWPGIWMMGNLGRAIFSASTNRMWPFSYDKCEPNVFDPKNQRINACNANPGYGLNPNQGRGAPEIDLLEGSGLVISSSLQIAPGMPEDFRLFPPNADGIDQYCVYTYDCITLGANIIDVPTSYYKKQRGHKSWYQGLRYGANNYCKTNATEKQDYDTVAASVKAGITENTCTVDTCPASLDVNGDLGFMDDTKTSHWGINSNGTCFAIMNSYVGAYLCDPDNTNLKCTSPRNSASPKFNSMSEFNYQVDAISSNWPVHLGAYLGYLKYQLEWVTGPNGYMRWMVDGNPLFEVTTDAFSNVPQNSKKNNPQKVMLEEPMYLIFNVALSKLWGTTPPNPGKECRGNGSDPVANAICDSFPMFMKVDYIRLYQDRGKDLDKDNYMQVGCDPSSHPTKQWIDEHIDEFVDNNNPWKEVSGKAFCSKDDDCTIAGDVGMVALKTGKCVKGRCECTYSTSWGGPRCTTALVRSTSTSAIDLSQRAYGPPMSLSVATGGLIVFLSMISVCLSMKSIKKEDEALTKMSAYPKLANSIDDGYDMNHSTNQRPKDNYSQNFV